MRALAPPAIDVVLRPDGSRCVVLTGCWQLALLRRNIGPLQERLADLGRRQGLWWDLTGTEALDSVSAAVLLRSWHGLRPPGLLARPEQETLIERLATAPRPAGPERPGASALVAGLGERTLQFLAHFAALVLLYGQLVLDSLEVLRRPRRGPWREWSASLYRAGATALPITALVGFLIGIVVSYLSAQQLRAFGANIFIVDLIGISVLREIAPLVTAIIVAGRSGSAYTAEIGTMRVTEELDALRTLGISPLEMLVLPKTLALVIALPLLTVYADLMGVFGGMIMGLTQLNVGFAEFVNRFRDAVAVKHYLIGLGKAPVFAVIIALVGCYQGFQVRGGADAVGRHATISVVQSIFLVIVVDAFFSVVFNWAGL